MDQLPPGVDLSQVPLAANPSGDPPNFIDPPTLAPAIIGVNSTLLVLTVVCVATRCWSNIKSTGKFGLDDYFAIIGLTTTVAYSCLVMSNTQMARHVWDISVATVFASTTIKKNFSGVVLGIPSMFFSKATIFVMYLRLFGVKNWFRYSCYVGLVVLFLSTWIALPLQIYYCAPRIGQGWDAALLMKCAPTGLLGVHQGVFSVALDLALLLLPVPVLLKLQMPTRRKIGLGVVFGTGILATTCSALALYSRVQMYLQTDGTWAAGQAYILMPVEAYSALLVSCAPALAGFWRGVLMESTTFSSLMTRLKSSVPSRRSQENLDVEPLHTLKNPSAPVIVKTMTVKQYSESMSAGSESTLGSRK